MTTIATDGKTMAGDSLTTAGPMITRHARKVFRLPDGRVYGCCGLSTSSIRFGRWLTDGGDAPKFNDEGFAALVLETDGTVTFFDDQMEAIFGYQVPTAIGSGCELAIGAMLMGADPKAAVEIAMSRDTRTGGEITVETVGAKLEAVA